MLDLNFLAAVLDLCVQSYAYCNIFQSITGIDVLSSLANNQLNVQLMYLIINAVNANSVNMASQISLSDIDLWELLRYAIQESGNTNIISAELLQSLGLYTNSILAYLISFGYIIQ